MANAYENFLEYRKGRAISDMAPAEAKDLAEFLQRKCWAAYTNPKHEDHEHVTADIKALHERATPTNQADQPL